MCKDTFLNYVLSIFLLIFIRVVFIQSILIHNLHSFNPNIYLIMNVRKQAITLENKAAVQQSSSKSKVGYITSAIHAKGQNLDIIGDWLEPTASMPVLDIATVDTRNALYEKQG